MLWGRIEGERWEAKGRYTVFAVSVCIALYGDDDEDEGPIAAIVHVAWNGWYNTTQLHFFCWSFPSFITWHTFLIAVNNLIIIERKKALIIVQCTSQKYGWISERRKWEEEEEEEEGELWGRCVEGGLAGSDRQLWYA